MQQQTQTNSGFVKTHKSNKQAKQGSSGAPAVAYRSEEQRGKQWKREDNKRFYLN